MQMIPTFLVHRNNPAFTHNANTYTETLLANQIYSITIFDNQDSLTFTDKYTALLQQELQNPYWNLHNPITTKSYQISKDMDIETMPDAMYFTGDTDTVTKINHVLYQTIVYNDNGMFTAKLHTGGDLIKSHFWLEMPLKLDHQTIQIKALVCDSECPYDLIL